MPNFHPPAFMHTLLRDCCLTRHSFFCYCSLGPWWPEETYDVAWSTEFLEHVGRQYMDNYMPVFEKVRGKREGVNLLRYPLVFSTPPFSPSTVGPGVLLELGMGGMAPRRGKRHPFRLHLSLISFLCITQTFNTPLTAPSSVLPPSVLLPQVHPEWWWKARFQVRASHHDPPPSLPPVLHRYFKGPMSLPTLPPPGPRLRFLGGSDQGC